MHPHTSHISQANQWTSGADVWLGLNELQGLGFQCVSPLVRALFD